MKKILGLDIGTNSIGWSVVELGDFGKEGNIIALGSRIIPMDGDAMQKFETGITVSKTADRRQARMTRRLKQRFALRRTRLSMVFKILGWIPKSFPIDFKKVQNENPDFKFNINDYLPFETDSVREAYEAFGSSKIPGDWIIYYLRHKALTRRISLTELARIIYMMNQRRGFKSSRKDKKTEEATEEEIKYPLFEKWVQIITVTEIKEISEEKGILTFQVIAGDITGQVKRRTIPDWLNKEMELEVTKKTVKSGEITYTFSLPDRTEWEKQKTAFNKDIRESIESGECASVGDYLYQHLKEDKNYRIRQRIVERELYREELRALWNTQKRFHPELSSKKFLQQLSKTLYVHNETKQKELAAKDLFYLLSNDIIYYQRPLKSQKDSIGFCAYEKKKDNKGNIFGVRVAPKSSPEFQEFRIWQTVHNLRVFRLEGEVMGRSQMDIDESTLFLTTDKKAKLFQLFDSRKEITHAAVLKELGITAKTHRLNYDPAKSFTGNETKEVFRKVSRKHHWNEADALLNDSTSFYRIWHILYSLNEPSEIKSALSNEKNGLNIPTAVIDHLSNLSDLPRQYGAYSSKAINKLLSLMRCGSCFNAGVIAPVIKDRIEKIITGEYDDAISDDLRDKIENIRGKFVLAEQVDFQGLPLWLAAYIIYGKHSEKENTTKYEHPDDIDALKLIPANSLRNPVVEQVSRETLSIVKKIWQQYGQPDEIHIELARDLKKTADERKRLSDIQSANENERKRIRTILRELINANPESPMDIERLRYWEETGNDTARNTSIKFSKEPTSTEIERYKLWGEQNHISPYSGAIIPLSKLFTPAYEIEHIIPRSVFFDDSFGNKTICESVVNDFKGNRIAREMMEKDGGRTITHKGSTFTLFKPEHYIDNCKRVFRGKKLYSLLREEIPRDFIERQVNDTRYITRKLSELLLPVAKDDAGIIFTIGAISSELKDKWGLNRVWKEILRPRFERLEQITGEQLIELDKDRNNIHFKKDYKRVDHRHHALDALIIACTTREHVRYLNSLNSEEEKKKYQYLVKTRYSDFVLPWDSFTKEVREKINEIIVSYKSNKRVLTKSVNKYNKWVQKKDGSWKKELQEQVKGKLQAIRKSMFKEPQGKITLREYKTVPLKQALEIQFLALKAPVRTTTSQIADKPLRLQVNDIIRNSAFDLKAAELFIRENPLTDGEGKTISRIQVTDFKEYAAKRVALDNSFTHDKINKIPNAQNSWLAILLHRHLENYNNRPEDAFRGEGLDTLYKTAGKPINKVTIYEEIGKKIAFKGKLVEADKGSNLFFIIYENVTTGERIITKESSISLLEVIERLTNQLPIAAEKIGYKPIVLSPNDLVYVPEEEENIKMIDWVKEKKKIHQRVYKVVSFTGAQCFFIPHYVSRALDEKSNELGSNNKSERSWNEEMIKKTCIKIKTDALGNITEVDGRKL